MANEKRIALCGASATGKTSLARHFSEKLKLVFNPIGSRSVAKDMGYDSPYDVDKAGKRFEFQDRLFKEKASWEDNRKEFITDRTSCDNLTYLALHDVYSISSDMLKAHFDHMRRYTHVIFTPMAFLYQPGHDHQRMHHMTYQKVYETLLQGFLEDSLRGQYFMVTKSTFEDRTAQIAEFLERADS